MQFRWISFHKLIDLRVINPIGSSTTFALNSGDTFDRTPYSGSQAGYLPTCCSSIVDVDKSDNFPVFTHTAELFPVGQAVHISWTPNFARAVSEATKLSELTNGFVDRPPTGA